MCVSSAGYRASNTGVTAIPSCKNHTEHGKDYLQSGCITKLKLPVVRLPIVAIRCSIKISS